MRTPVHDRCVAIAALALGLVLLGVNPAEAEEPESTEAEEPGSTEAEEPAAPAPVAPTSGAPSGPPPALTAADAGWHERSDESAADAETQGAPSWSPDVGLGAQVFGVSGKAMVGLSLRVGDGLFWGELEFTPLWITKASADFSGSFLGNQWGFYFSLAPLRTRFVEGLLGVGLDVFHLWGVHSDEVFTALSFKGAVHVRPTSSISIFATVRSYALHSSGVELGTHRNGERTIPLVGTLGSEWRFE